MSSALSHLQCSKCAATYDADVVQHLCTCGAPLLARYDMQTAARTFTRESLAAREPSMWRYEELLPLREVGNRVTLQERMTPILALNRMGAAMGLQHLFMKDDGVMPTGSFKARGAAVGISRAHELHVDSFALPTNGNAGGAWSAYAARAGMSAYVFMPRSAPAISRFECSIAGAHVQLVDGLIGDAAKNVGEAVARHGYYDASTLKEPYRVEGKKTLGFEIAEQFEWNLPDVIAYPTGGGLGLIGIDKALLELRALNLIADRMPRMVAVQAEGCAPIVKAWRHHAKTSVPWENGHTIAFGINVPKALGDFLVLEAIERTGGCAVAVNDAQILKMQRSLASTEGPLICLEGAATLAAVANLRRDGWIEPHERVLLVNTGSGLKSATRAG